MWLVKHFSSRIEIIASALPVLWERLVVAFSFPLATLTIFSDSRCSEISLLRKLSGSVLSVVLGVWWYEPFQLVPHVLILGNLPEFLFPSFLFSQALHSYSDAGLLDWSSCFLIFSLFSISDFLFNFILQPFSVGFFISAIGFFHVWVCCPQIFLVKKLYPFWFQGYNIFLNLWRY